MTAILVLIFKLAIGTSLGLFLGSVALGEWRRYRRGGNGAEGAPRANSARNSAILEGVCPECLTSMGHHVASCPVWRRWRNEALDKMPPMISYEMISYEEIEVARRMLSENHPRSVTRTRADSSFATVEDLLGKTVDE